jgi:predicted lipoprotein with Yx(FWY)xxD motif
MKNTVCGNAVYYFARDAALGDPKVDGKKEIWLLAKP